VGQALSAQLRCAPIFCATNAMLATTQIIKFSNIKIQPKQHPVGQRYTTNCVAPQ